jgi:hypothetical protein
MDIKRIIREEIEDFNWIGEIDPYSFVKDYYNKFPANYKISRMSNDYAHLKSDKKNLKEILRSMGYEGTIDEPLMLKALTKYYKENVPLIKRFWSRFNYDDLEYVHNQIIDSIFENTEDFDWIRDVPAKEAYKISSEPNLYIDDEVVQNLGLPDSNFILSRGEKNLGNFRWTSSGIPYRFTASLYPITYSDGKKMWRVMGTSGDHGFGYSWITKRNTLGKRARMQIFKQIIDRYNLDRFI